MRALRSTAVPAAPADPAARRRRIVVALAAVEVTCLLAAATTAAALDPERRITQCVRRTWTVEDGLPQSSVTDLAQDRDGYLWITTFGGLARFDGVHFELFIQANHPGLPSDRLLSLVEDPSGGLWIGTERSGLARFQDGTLRAVVPFPDTPSAHIITLRIGSSGDLWVGTDRGLLHRGPGGWERFGRADGLPHDRVLSVLEDPDGELWVGTAAGLVRRRGDRFVPVLPKLLAGRAVFSLYRDTAGWTWAGAGRGFLVRWRRGVVEEVSATLDGDTVRDILEDHDGNLWVALNPGGVRRLTRHGWESYRRREGLPVDRALSLLEDREGNLWVGTSGGGLHQLSVGEAVAFGGPGHPLSASVLPIVDDGAGGIWAGLVCGGLAHLDAAGDVRRLAEPDGLTNSCVASLLRGAAGELWIGTMGGGLFLRDGGRIRAVALPTSSPGTVRALLADRGGGLIVGSDDGLFRSRGDPRRPDARFDLLPGSAGLDVYTLTEDEAGRLWIGTLRGVWLRRPGGERIEPLLSAPASLRGATVRTIYPTADGSLWFGTYGRGLFRLRAGRFVHIGRREGLAEEIVSWIAEDRLGRLWMTGNRGVQRLPLRDLEAVADGRQLRVQPLLFGADDGMPASETNGGGQPAGLLTADGMLWVPTADGVARFDTTESTIRHTAPPVHIESVRLDGRPLSPELLAGDAPVALGSGVRNLEIQYTALAFSSPSRVHFRYRLAGEDEDWLDVGTRRVAYFPFLPPGRHRFQVSASDEDREWGEQSATFTFDVAPRFVETPLLPLLLLALVALAVLVGVRLRLRALRNRERRLAAEVAARTAELEETRADLERANLRLSRLANLDALTSIPNRRGLMERLVAEWRRSMRQGRPLGLLMIDLDQFKAYNDLHGHPAGDRCLQRVVHLIDGSLRRADEMLARYGGEELLAMVPEVPSVEALAELAELLRRRVEAAHIPHGGSNVSDWVTVSIGGAVFVPSLDNALESLLSAADAALYRAKQRGRNRVEVVDSTAGVLAGDDEDGKPAGDSAAPLAG